MKCNSLLILLSVLFMLVTVYTDPMYAAVPKTGRREMKQAYDGRAIKRSSREVSFYVFGSFSMTNVNLTKPRR